MTTSRQVNITAPLLSLQQTNALKGLLAITVLIHHIGQNTTFLDGTFFEAIIESLGYLSVSGFLFLSGYGLALSYNLKGEGYIKAFPKNKLLPFYIQNLILIAIYYIFWQIIGEALSTRRIVLSFFFGHTVIKYGWYIQATLVLYIIFYLSFKFKNKYIKISVLLLGYTLYFAHCITNGYWAVWYISVLAFLVGVVFANISPHPKKQAFISFLGFVIFYALSLMLGGFYAKAFKMAVSVFFPIFITSVFSLLPFNFSKLTRFSKISFEIYVLQGLFLTLYHSKLIYIKNEFLYIFVSIISIILFSILLNKFLNLVTNKIKKA